MPPIHLCYLIWGVPELSATGRLLFDILSWSQWKEYDDGALFGNVDICTFHCLLSETTKWQKWKLPYKICERELTSYRKPEIQSWFDKTFTCAKARSGTKKEDYLLLLDLPAVGFYFFLSPLKMCALPRLYAKVTSSYSFHAFVWWKNCIQVIPN